MDKLENRLIAIEQQLAQLIGMVAKMSKETNERFNNLEDKFFNLDSKFDSFRKEVQERFDKVDTSMEHLAQKWLQTDREVYYLKHQFK